MLFNISCIQCEIFAHTWQINITPLSVTASVCAIHHKKIAPHNVEPVYYIIVGPSKGVNIGVDRQIGEKTTIQVRIILHLYPKF
jgi:hypothetical protein